MQITLTNHKGSLYTNTIPAGAKIIGDINRENRAGRGALALLASGRFAQFNGGCMREIDQREVYKAIVKALVAEAGTQVAFSERVGFSISTIKSWTSGRRVPNFAIIRLLLIEHNSNLL